MTIFSQSKKINQSQKGILTCVMMKKEGGLYGKKKRKRKEKEKSDKRKYKTIFLGNM